MRYPRSFTCSSIRPTNSSVPSANHRTRSPVRYNRSPPDALNGSAMNFCAVSPPRFTYPRARPAPPMYSSPTTPIGTACRCSSNTYICVFAIGRPIGTDVAPPLYCPQHVATVTSVGPYPLMSTQRFAHSSATSAAQTSPVTIKVLTHGSADSSCSSASTDGGSVTMLVRCSQDVRDTSNAPPRPGGARHNV